MTDPESIKEFIPDRLLASDADCPVFGFNLACAFPFPPEIAAQYERLMENLKSLHPGLYVYPLWETHVTIVTFVNFTRQCRPTKEQLAELEPLLPRVERLIGTTLLPPPFQLVLGPPRLTPKAIILPIRDDAQAIPRLRESIRAGVAADSRLHEELERAGWNIPGIIHSTMARFTKAPAHGARFSADFARVASGTDPMILPIHELLMTTETKPYMRGGEIIRRFPLAQIF